jgi:hypothetical protein
MQSAARGVCRSDPLLPAVYRIRLPPQVTATISRGRMKRAFVEWRRICEDRWWKNQLAGRDAQVGWGGVRSRTRLTRAKEGNREP